MAVNIRKFGKLLNILMYGDLCSVYRSTDVKDIYGETKPDQRQLVYENIKCKFSFSEKDDPNDTNGVYMPVLKQVVLFTDLDHDILPGDLIKGYRVDSVSGIKQEICGLCGEPNRFDTHQEIPIQIDGAN